MAFLVTLIQTLMKVCIVGAVAFGGVQFGRLLRKKHDEKKKA